MKEQDDFFLIHSPGDYELWKLCKLLVEAVEWRPEPGGDSGALRVKRMVLARRYGSMASAMRFMKYSSDPAPVM